MAGTIVVDIVARDLLTPVINNLRGSYLGNLGADLTMAGLNGVLGKLQEIGSSLTKATQAQTKFISDANNLGLSTGLSLGLAESTLDDINQKIAKNAAALPGTTEQYVKLANYIASAVAEGKNLHDPVGLAKYKQQLEEIATQYTLISQAVPNLDSEATGDFVRRLLGGKESFGSLKQLQFAQGNPDFQKYLKEELAKQNKTLEDWTKLDQDNRFTVIQAVGKRIGNSGYITRLQGTADAMIEGLKSNLFDPLIGVFGFRRKIDDAGGRTVLDSFTGFLQSWLGLGSTVSTIAQKLGLSFDPLEPLVDVIDFVTDIGTKADLWLSSMNFSQGFGSLDFSSLGSGLFDWLSGFWNGIIKNLLGLTFNFDTHDIVKAVVGFIESLIKGFISLQANFDWAGVGRFVGLWLVKLPSIILQALIKFNWALIPQTLLFGLVGFFKFLGGLLFGVAEGLLNEIPMLLETWVDKILDNFRAVFDGFKWLADTIMGWIDRARNLVPNAGRAVVNTMPPEVKQAIKDLPAPVKDAAKVGINAAGNLIPGVGLVKTVTGIIDLMTGKAGDNTSLSPNTINPNKPLTIPAPDKPQKVASAFAPVINIPVQSQADPEQIANMVSDRIAIAYNRYVQEQLA